MDVVTVIEPVVLLVSNKEDLSLDYVVAELTKRNICFFRLNSEDILSYKSTFALEQQSFVLRTTTSEIRLGAGLQSIVYRRPGQPYIAPDQQHDSRIIEKYICDQWSVFITGLRALSHVRWINSPEADSYCENKILQLSAARNLGMIVPKTIISTDKDKIQKFFFDLDSECVVKALSSPLLELESGDYFVFSNVISSLEAIGKEEFKSAPTIFQERIKSKTDIRVTVCGNKIFAVEILKTDNSDVPFDWRTCEEELTFKPIDLPKDLQSKCFRLVNHFSLTFGALDFVRTEDNFIFLEINPAGEWGWLQRKADLPIAEALVDAALKTNIAYDMA